MNNLIIKQDAIDEIASDAEYLKRVLDDTDIVGNEREKFAWGLVLFESLIEDIKGIPSVGSEIIRCRYCKYWNEGNCNCPDIRVDCPDYYVGDIVTEEDFYCGFAKRRENE